uniref:Pancreatic polypeptide n=2 Tax=Lynx canadensis TaxID=61383 RepID=A0A667HD43_LYNCA
MSDGSKGRAGGLSSASILLLLVPQMPVARRCLSLLLLSACVALLLQPPLGARGAPLEPVYPGDNATPEQMAQYAAELRRYINMLTRPRYGKRDRGETLDILEWGSPLAAAPRELSPMDV